ncbi:hypothetical protein BOTBODRAFT_66287 [Botryobasidium botryosum FD-172 SS1]|uniref:F-box domain-containing protein n=1 Tax=Botryobasidium botryosum (strain FD-172 SS1) TaxID=930990 RepID=A0A067ME99_BOTB1|nr:hypothetical protein BOTBODRAFT_66287 [Botryobasidium botryosum FD-172 SS1]
MATARSHLVALPKELIFQIIGELDLAALLRLSVACKSLYHLISSSAPIQYRIELERAGYINGSAAGPLTITQRRARLRKHSRAWHGLSWARSIDSELDSRFTHYYLYGGTIAFAIPSPSGTRLSFYELPSTISRTLGLEWPFEVSFNFGIWSFAFDQEQDLLVLIEKCVEGSSPRVHIMSMTTNMPHPSAKVHVLQAPPLPPGIQSVDASFWLETVGDTIGLLVRLNDRINTDGESYLIMWQWVTGLVKVNVTFPKYEAPDIFSFVSPTTFALSVISRQPAAALGDTLPSKTPMIEIYQVHDDNTHPLYPRPIHCATFLLPRIRDHIQVVEFLGRSEPPPVHQSFRSQQRPRPFHFASEDRIFCFFLDIRREIDAGPHALMFTRSSTLSNYTNYLSTDHGHARRIPWEEWGPPNTRWLEGNFASTSDHTCYVYGSRFAHRVSSSYDGDDDEIPIPELQTIDMFDFNPYAVEHEVRNGAAGDGGEGTGEDGSTKYDAALGITYRSITSPSIIPAGSLFVDDVHSSLPYREIHKVVKYAEDFSVLMDEENLIFLTERDTMRVCTM